jgi:hypothetical protein
MELISSYMPMGALASQERDIWPDNLKGPHFER